MIPAVFLDTVGMVAVWDQSDQWHDSADRVFRSLVRANRVLVTTSLVFIECGNAAARTPFRARVDALRRTFLIDGRLIEPTEEDYDQAWAAYARGEAGRHRRPRLVHRDASAWDRPGVHQRRPLPRGRVRAALLNTAESEH